MARHPNLISDEIRLLARNKYLIYQDFLPHRRSLADIWLLYRYIRAAFAPEIQAHHEAMRIGRGACLESLDQTQLAGAGVVWLVLAWLAWS
jgi:hypothetical protein